MGNFLVLFSLLFSLAAGASTPGGIPLILLGVTASTPGGTSAIELSNPGSSGGAFSVYAGNAAANLTADDFYPFIKNGAVFSVSSGTKAYCFSSTDVSDGVNGRLQFVSATASFSYAATSITGGVHQSGAAARYILAGSPTANIPVPIGNLYVFDGTSATVYPGIQVNSSSMTRAVTLNCYVK